MDPETRCAHWQSECDVVAIKFKCCGQFYACYECHQALAGHRPELWSKQEHNHLAILCGRCKNLLTIEEYLNCASKCPRCGGAFNPGCEKHWHLYFTVTA